MGAYLSTPNTKKSSLDLSDNTRYACAVSSMQGWRMNMEDAFTCTPDLEENTGLFAVYDGHGGADVAIYCACHLAEVLKEKEEYKSGNYEEALRKTFMDIDKILIHPKTASELKFLSKRDPSDPPPTAEDLRKHEEEENEANEEAKLLCEEATMDIVDVLKRYGAALNADEDEEVPPPPVDDGCASSASAKKPTVEKSTETSNSSKEKEISKSNDDDKKPVASESSEPAKEKESEISDKKPEAAKTDNESSTSSSTKSEEKNGKEETASSAASTVTKTESKPKFKKVKLKPQKKAPVEDESDDEDYTGFESDEAIEGSDDDDESDIDSDEIDSDDEEIVMDNGEEEDIPADEMGSMTDIPGCDSGTTAVVALLRGKDLYVANAGDSRAIICRKGGITEDMSFDHKPEDEKELNRITKAGGRVNAQGRVNGGLNLSRAIGDHFYKKNKDLSLEEQMITAMPDIKKVTLQDGDEFMVLACDGIWNVMSSEEVVKFVRDRLNGQVEQNDAKTNGACGENGENGNKKSEKQDKLSQICEEMFDHCMAPDTMGDGTGCDNMTCIIVQFNKDWLKQEEASPVTAVEALEKKVIVGGAGGELASCNGDSPAGGKRPRQDEESVVNSDESDSKRTKAAVAAV